MDAYYVLTPLDFILKHQSLNNPSVAAWLSGYEPLISISLPNSQEIDQINPRNHGVGLMERLNRTAIFSKKPAKMEIEEG
jgi:hypothetical protein